MHLPKIKNSDELIKNYCHDKFMELYGKNAPEEMKARLDYELSSIINHNFVVHYLIAKHIADESRKMGYPVFTRGSVGSSFVALLLGFTGINPLKPHYLCTNCKSIQFVSDVASGYDLPNKDCHICGAIMKGDGHNIPFETFAGLDGDKKPEIVLNVAAPIKEKAKELLQSLFPNDKIALAGTIRRINIFGKDATFWKSKGVYPGCFFIIPNEYSGDVITELRKVGNAKVEVTKGDYHEIWDDFLKFDILEHSTSTLLVELSKQTGVLLDSIPANDEKAFALITAGENNCIVDFNSVFVKNMIEDCNPTCFSELCKISGLSHGTDVWNNNAEDLIFQSKATIKEVLAFRDDVFEYLITIGAERANAYKIMEKVRKGKGLYEDDLKGYKLPNWFYESANKIKYMFPKAHAVSYVKMAMQLAWFKVNYHDLSEAEIKRLEK